MIVWRRVLIALPFMIASKTFMDNWQGGFWTGLITVTVADIVEHYDNLKHKK